MNEAKGDDWIEHELVASLKANAELDRQLLDQFTNVDAESWLQICDRLE